MEIHTVVIILQLKISMESYKGELGVERIRRFVWFQKQYNNKLVVGALPVDICFL